MVGKLVDAEARARAILMELGREDLDGLATRLATIERDARWPRIPVWRPRGRLEDRFDRRDHVHPGATVSG